MTTESADATTAADNGAESTTYRVSVDLDACDGVFACLVRDDRFVEADDGLVGFDPADAAAPIERDADGVAATFRDGRIDEARAGAAACPLDAITVEEREGEP
ncbi:ferredoxin [Halorubrum tebenquichense]|uniref:Ferredoxin n=1 Tax=Halorubrum tebenquichense DSM 14210 TaxID=1227485 RepID=M0E0A3_9EURY|nr:ferredoxin [Halorubrum tebenquichense]ELZ39779.1 hypothetical protein C472_03109 [Halorubrum tebenquichense DSM 14210]